MKERFEKVKLLLNEKLILYPILTGILFLCNELRNNAFFYTLKENVSLILIVLAFTLFVDFLSRKFIKNKTKAALIAALFVFINLFYKDIFLFILGQKVLINFINSTTSNHPQVIIVPVILIVWVFFTFFVLRTKRFFTGLNLYLNIVITAFILFETTQWLIVPVPQIKLTDNKPFPVNADLSSEQKPDIYYIILDSYTSSESLRKYWNYDNFRFEDSLKQLGFFIAHKSESDFTSTYYCLASYLNSSSLLLDSTKRYNDKNLLQLIRKNRLFDWLRANDYLCYNFSLFDVFGSKSYFWGYEMNHFLGRTIWYAISAKLYHFLKPSSLFSPTNLRIFSELSHMRKERCDKPIFTYAHVGMPHFPYSFNEYGKPFNASDSFTDKQKYLGQLIFTNSLTLESINQILKFSPRKPIIVIHGDHGFRGLEDTTLIERSHEAHTIFYAIYTPDGITVPDTINPKNTFKKMIEYINH